MEEVAEKGKMGLDPKESLTEVNKNSHMDCGIWVEMMELESIEIKKAMKKVGGREGQSLFDKICEKDDFINIFLRI